MQVKFLLQNLLERGADPVRVKGQGLLTDKDSLFTVHRSGNIQSHSQKLAGVQAALRSHFFNLLVYLLHKLPGTDLTVHLKFGGDETLVFQVADTDAVSGGAHRDPDQKKITAVHIIQDGAPSAGGFRIAAFTDDPDLQKLGHHALQFAAADFQGIHQ